MSSPGSREPNPGNNDPSATQQQLALALEQIRATIGEDWAAEVLPPDCTLTSIRTEVYQSRELQAAHAALPDTYDEFDRSLIILGLQDRRQVFLLSGRVRPDDRFDFEQSIGGGVDQRKLRPTVYAYDGVGTITEYMPDEPEPYIYTGEAGDPKLLLASIRPRLGVMMAAETLELT